MPPEVSPPPPAPAAHRRRRRWGSCLPLSCFGHASSSTASAAGDKGWGRSWKAAKLPASSWLPSLRKVKRSLSVRSGAVSPETEPEDGCREEGKNAEIPAIVVAAVRPAFLQSLFTKDNKEKKRRKGSNGKSGVKTSTPAQVESTSEITILPPPPNNHQTTNLAFGSSSASPISETNRPSVDPQQSSSPSPSANKRSCQTPKSPARQPQCSIRACKNIDQPEALAGLVALTLMLLLLAVGGRVFAMLCMSAFFYLFSFLKGPEQPPAASVGVVAVKDKKHVKMGGDYDSEEYRKKVLMEGLLRREGRQRLAA